MKDLDLSAHERNLICSAPVEKCELTKELLWSIIDWQDEELMTKKDVVDFIFSGMFQGYVRLLYDKFRREKIFSGTCPTLFDEAKKVGGEYLADYQNSMLMVCRFTGSFNTIAEVRKIYEFTNLRPAVKIYQQVREVLWQEDDPGVVYQRIIK